MPAHNDEDSFDVKAPAATAPVVAAAPPVPPVTPATEEEETPTEKHDEKMARERAVMEKKLDETRNLVCGMTREEYIATCKTQNEHAAFHRINELARQFPDVGDLLNRFNAVSEELKALKAKK